MGSWQENAKPVQRKTKSRRVDYKAVSVNAEMVCNPHVELPVLWDFIRFIVRFKRSQIMRLRGTLNDRRNILIAL